jgi:hypothetical protein
LGHVILRYSAHGFAAFEDGGRPVSPFHKEVLPCFQTVLIGQGVGEVFGGVIFREGSKMVVVLVGRRGEDYAVIEKELPLR